MRTMLLSAAVTLALSACGGDGDGATGPSALNMTGTFVGDFATSVNPGVGYRAVLELAQSGAAISGTLATSADRFADFSGSVAGSRLTGTFTFTDGCAGTASATADITNNGTRLTGNYAASDCIGSSTGSFALDKEPGTGSTLVTATGPSPAHLVVKNGRLFWSEAGEEPISAISLGGGSPVVLAQQIGAPAGIAVRGQEIFWLDEGSGQSTSGCVGAGVARALKKTPINGGTTTVLATGDACAGGTTDLVVDATHVYWVTSTGSPNTYFIRKTPVGGGTSTTLTTTSVPIVALAGDAGNLYWMENLFPDPVGAIRKVPTSGGSPATLASGFISRAGTFAINSASVFYTEANFPSSDKLIEVLLAGGPPVLLATLAGTPWKLVADDTNLYWIDSATVSALSLAGGSPRVLSNTLNTPLDLVVRSDDIVWSETTGPAHGETGAVKSVAKTGGPAVVLAQGGDAPRRLSVDASWAYWTEGGPFGLLEGGARIARVPAGGGAVQTVVSGVASRSPIAVDEAYVFVADRWRVKRVPVSGGTVEQVAAASFYIRGLVTDGAYVYWLEGGPFAIVRKVPVDGGPVTTLGSGGGDPAGPMRLDASHVYWMAGEDAVFRVPKEGGNVEAVVGPIPGLVTDFVVDGVNVYFSEWDSARIRKKPIGGGDISTLVTPRPDQTRRLATDGLSVYWIDQRELGKIPAIGGTASVIVSGRLASDPFFAASIVLDATSLYWTEPPIRQIRKASK